jgi:N-methylhydantoinase A
VLVAYGGAGPTHAAFYGADISVKEILIPAESTAFSAAGMLVCDVIRVVQGADERILDALEDRVLEQFASEGVRSRDVQIERYVEAHYGQQVQTLAVPVKPGDDVPPLFEALYEETFGAGSGLAGSRVQISGSRVVGTVAVERPVTPERPNAGPDPSAALRGSRDVHFAEWIDTPVYRGEVLNHGNVVAGPAIVQRMGDSVVVPPGHEAAVDAALTLHLRQTT